MTDKKINDAKLERVIRKIKRCLALSASSNETEAATAMRQAQALMREYRLTEIDVHLSDVGEVESECSRVKRRPTWDRQLGSIVGEAFSVRSFSRRQWCKSTSRIIECELYVGVNPAPQIAMYAYEALLTKLTTARREYVSRVRKGEQRSDYSPETAGNHFALAWVSAVYEKIHQLVPRGEGDQAIGMDSTGQDLMAVEAQHHAPIEQFLSDREIGKARKTREVELDLNAHIAGLLAGERVELNPGMTHPGQAVLRIRSSTDHI